MIKKGDKVRVVFDGGDVETGYVRNKFTGKDNIQYLELDTGRAYTVDEVTKIPNKPISESNLCLEPQEAPSHIVDVVEEQEEPAAYPEAVEKYDFDKDDRPDEYKQENDMPAITPLLEQIDTMRNTINQMVAYLELADDKQAKEYLEMLRGVSDEL